MESVLSKDKGYGKIRMDASLEYLEIQITDSCNLNCKGCSHCAGIIKKQHHVPLEFFQSDLKRMKELVPQITKIRILGGEPLLNPKLEDYFIYARSVYPESDIRITTNGTLILTKGETFFQKLHAYKIGLDISVYPPVLKHLEEIKEILRRYKVKYKCTETIQKFAKRISLDGKSEIEQTFYSCNSKWCNFLREGVLSLCPAPIILEWLAKHFDFQVDTNAGKLDLYDPLLVGEHVVKFLNSPNPVCRYCVDLEFFDWEQNAVPKLEDWVIIK